MDPAEEKRQDPRVSLILQVEYPEREGFIAPDSTENLGAGGAFVRTDRPFTVGDRVPVVLSFPGLLEPLTVTGVVAWVRAKKGDQTAGVGLRIAEDRPEDRQRLAAITARLRAAPAVKAAGPTPSAAGYRVLIVEDNPHLSDMYQYVIRKMERMETSARIPMEVAICGDGHEAWLKLCAERFDLVLADMYMPVMDGFELIAKMRADPKFKDTPIVSISAGGEQAAQRASKAGANVCLRKPVRFVEVLETVRTLLKLRT